MNRYVAALQWLTDMGMITFETMTVDTSTLTLRQAALTSRGRDYIQSTATSTTQAR